MAKKIIVVGSGFAGAYISRELADHGYQVNLIERRDHIGGNMYDEIDKETGCLFHKYGPHIFHTNNEEIWNWVNKFAEFTPFSLKTRVLFEEPIDWFTCSFGFHTIEQLFDKEKAKQTIETLKKEYKNQNKVTIPELMKSNNKLIKDFTNILWEQDYKPYTSKQWGLKPEEVDIDILKRVPVYLSYFDKIHQDEFEGVPKKGYTALFDAILKHDNITVNTSTDVLNVLRIGDSAVYSGGEPISLVYTGAIDELFDYELGFLGYRSLKFKKEVTMNDKKAIIGDPCVDIYPSLEHDFTRITNYGKLPIQNHLDYQVSMAEYPLEFKMDKHMERYYPLSTEKDKALFVKYKELASNIDNLYLVGRLANYKYYNMDEVLIEAKNIVNRILEELK